MVQFLLPAHWCRRRDSNSHSFRHYPLKIACLPISPRRRSLCYFGISCNGLLVSEWPGFFVLLSAGTVAAAGATPCITLPELPVPICGRDKNARPSVDKKNAVAN